MCGIVGMAGDLTHRLRERAFPDMLNASAARGKDSTGVVRVDNDDEYDWVKQVGSPAYLYDSRQWDSHIMKGTAKILIGHTRAKTVGEVSVKNAHPFEIEDANIIGVHNGTLNGHYRLDGYHHSLVDSEVLYKHLAVNGPQKTFNTLNGAWACVWWDGNDNTLNFIRNEQRPLFFAWSKDYKQMFWASEIGMFWTVAREVELLKDDKGKVIYHELPVNTLWSFVVTANPKEGENRFYRKGAVEILPEKKPTYNHNSFGGGRFNQEEWRRQHRANTGSDPVANAVQKAAGGEVANPFLVTDLNDPLPDELAPKGNEPTQISSIAFLRNSVTNSGGSTESSSPTKSSRKTLSLPSPASSPSIPTPSDQASKNSEPSSGNVIKANFPDKKKRSSLRQVAGIEFISCLDTGVEYATNVFRANTDGGRCSHCKTMVDMGAVAVILSATSFICTECLSDVPLQAQSACN